MTDSKGKSRLDITDCYAKKASYKKRLSDEYEPGLVSVIIPTYNRADCIAKTIESVLTQTYKDYEVIVVDDGSTDNTKQVLEPYIDRSRIRYIYQENAGCASARNTGIRASRGQWTAFLDSDDRWHPEYLESQMKCLKHLSTKVSVANISPDYKGKNDSVGRHNNLELRDDNFQFVSDPLEITLVHNELTVTLQGMVIERKLIEQLGGFDERVFWASDRRFILRLATATPFAYLNQKLVILDRTPERERLTKDLSHEAQMVRSSSHVLNYAEVYFRCRKQSKQTIKKARYMLGSYLSALAMSCCLDNDNYNARRFARDGIYFGGQFRVYVRCFCVLVCPWLVRWLSKNH